MPPEIPEPVRLFLTRHIDSVSTLDALLLLRVAPDKTWSAAELGRALVSSETAATHQLERLLQHRLLAREPAGFRYAPRQDEQATIDDLAECYARRRTTVIGLIYGADQRPATALADAFRFRRKRSDG
jgi:hypothetical protein